MKYSLLLVLGLCCSINLSGQTIINMEQSGGVYYIPCEVNGLRLQFVFDTGASDVSISMAEALFMLKNDYLRESDIQGTNRYRTASGSIEEGTSIILRQIKIGDKYLYNVEASIVNSLDAPLLLGQSALSKLGNISIDYSKHQLIIGGKSIAQSNSKPEPPSPEEYFASDSQQNENYHGIEPVRIGNIEVMTADLGKLTWNDAIKECSALGDGWRLPNKDELSILYENKKEIGGFTVHYYWSLSSSRDNTSKAWIQCFEKGYLFTATKKAAFRVRAVRTL